MVVRQQMQHIEQKAFWLVEGMRVPVVILDIRQVYGRTDYLITVDGTKSKWVSQDRLQIK